MRTGLFRWRNGVGEPGTLVSHPTQGEQYCGNSNDELQSHAFNYTFFIGQGCKRIIPCLKGLWALRSLRGSQRPEGGSGSQRRVVCPPIAQMDAKFLLEDIGVNYRNSCLKKASARCG